MTARFSLPLFIAMTMAWYSRVATATGCVAGTKSTGVSLSFEDTVNTQPNEEFGATAVRIDVKDEIWLKSVTLTTTTCGTPNHEYVMDVDIGCNGPAYEYGTISMGSVCGTDTVYDISASNVFLPVGCVELRIQNYKTYSIYADKIEPDCATGFGTLTKSTGTHVDLKCSEFYDYTLGMSDDLGAMSGPGMVPSTGNFKSGADHYGVPTNFGMSYELLHPQYSVSTSPAVSTVIAEGSSVSFTVSRVYEVTGSAQTVAIQLDTGSSTATAADVSIPGACSMTFSSGQTSKSCTVSITDDTNAEVQEDLVFKLAAASMAGKCFLINEFRYDIALSDPIQVEFRKTTDTFAEGVSHAVALDRTGGTDGFTIDPSLTDGTTTGGEVSCTPAALTFGSGEMSKSLTCTATADGVSEGDEDFYLDISWFSAMSADSSLYGIGTNSQITLTVQDGTAGSVEVSDATRSVAEGSPATFSIVRSGGSGAFTVSYTLNAGTATGGDYSACTPSSPVSFGAGINSVGITCPTVQDTLYEGAESYVFSLTSATNGLAVVSPDSVTITITGPNDASTVTLGVASATANEGSTATFNINRAGGTDPFDVHFVMSGTATPGSDYSACTPASPVTFTNQFTKTVTCAVVDDTLNEPLGETITMTLQSTGLPTGVSLGSPVLKDVTIPSNDPSTYQFSTSSDTVAEGGTATVSIVRTGGTGTFAASYTVGGTATYTTDYTCTPASPVNFGVDDTNIPITCSVVDDAYCENGETIILQLSNVSPAGYSVGATDSFTATIASSDPITIKFANSPAVYNVVEESGPATLTLERLGGLGAITVTITLTPGTASTSDYNPSSITVSFATGDPSKTFDIPITDDSDAETAESFTATITAITAPGPAVIDVGNNARTVTIGASDTPVVQFSASGYPVSEGDGTVTLTVVRSGGVGAFTVDVKYTAATATAGADYTDPGVVTLSFGPSDNSKTTTVAIADDNLGEVSETFTATLENISGGTAVLSGTTSATVTIAASDPFSYKFSSASYAGSETAGTIPVTFGRTGTGKGAFTLKLTMTAGTATAGDDFDASNILVPFGVNDMSAVANVPVVNDDWPELSETVNLSMSLDSFGPGIGNGVSTGGNAKTLTITDNDACTVTSATKGGTDGTDGSVDIAGTSFGANPSTMQGGGTATYTVTIGTYPPAPAIWSSANLLRTTAPEGLGTALNVKVETDGGNSGSVVGCTGTSKFTYLPPHVTGMVPNPKPKAQGLVTLQGSNFGPAGHALASVAVSNAAGNAVTCTSVTVVDHDRITCFMSSGSGNGRDITVTVASQPDPGALFSFNWVDVNLAGIAPATLPPSGGTITLVGTNFGPTPGLHTIAVGTMACTPTSVVGGTTGALAQVICNLPAGVGGNHLVNVKVGPDTGIDSSAPVGFSYDRPIVSTGVATATAGGLITVTGGNFGTVGDVAVTVGGSACTSATRLADDEITCVVPAGMGKSHNLAVTVPATGPVAHRQDSIANTLFDYLVPTLVGFTPAVSGPTAGGNVITLSGTNFGPSAPAALRQVSIAGTLCTPVGYLSHTELTCTVPQGAGTLRNVVVSVLNQDTSANVIPYDYKAPNVTALVPSNGPTVGGTVITVYGHEFGIVNTHLQTVTLSGIACATPAWVSATEIVCTTSAGTGNSKVPIAIVGGQPGSGTARFTYDAPVVTGVVSLSPQVEVHTVQATVPWNGPFPGVTPTIKAAQARGGARITVQGYNFGTANVGQSVTVGGSPCSTATWISDTEVACDLPQGNPGLVDVVLTTDGQSGSNGNVLAYYPHWTARTLAGNGPARGGTRFEVDGIGFNPAAKYACTFVDGLNPIVRSALAFPVSAFVYQCTTPMWPYKAGSAVMQLEDAFGNIVRNVDLALTFTFDEDFDHVETAPGSIAAVPGLPLTITVRGGGFDPTEGYRCFLNGTNATETVVVTGTGGNTTTATTTTIHTAWTSAVALPTDSSTVLCVFDGVQTFAFGSPAQLAKVTLHKGGAPDDNVTATVAVTPSVDDPSGSACCGQHHASVMDGRAVSFEPVIPPGALLGVPSLVSAHPFALTLSWPGPTIAQTGGSPVTAMHLYCNGTRVGTVAGQAAVSGHVVFDAGATAGGTVWPERGYSLRLAFENVVGLGTLGPALEVATPPSAPLLSTVVPEAVSTIGGLVVTVTGEQFGHASQELLSVSIIGAGPAIAFSWISATSIEVTTPASPTGPGPLPINITTVVGTSQVYAAGGAGSANPNAPVNSLVLEYNPLPNITAVEPWHHPRAATTGGVTITIHGRHLGATASDFMGASLAGVPCSANATQWVSPSKILCVLVQQQQQATVPLLGPVSVTTHLGGPAVSDSLIASSTVRTAEGGWDPAAAGALTAGSSAHVLFWHTAPTARSVLPSSGGFRGGTRVTVSGHWLGTSAADVVSVEFEPGQRCAVAAVSSAGVTGAVPGSPGFNMALESGGFTISCDTPPAVRLGPVRVRVTTVSGGVGPWLESGYTYTRAAPYTRPPPWVTAVEPPVGSILGGEIITLRGFNLGVNEGDLLEVNLAGVPCVLHKAAEVAAATTAGSPSSNGAGGLDLLVASYRSEFELVCVSGGPLGSPVRGSTFVPEPEAERVTVVTVAGGTSELGAPFWYRWPRPTIDRVRPRVSLNEGGAVVTLRGAWFLPYDSQPEAFIEGVPCAATAWASETEVVCTTPPASSILDDAVLASGKLAFTIHIEGQVSDPVESRFVYGFVCDPPCGWDADCDIGADSNAAVCTCHRYWSGPPSCDQNVVSFTNLTARHTDEEGHEALIAMRIVPGPLGDPPTADVTFRVSDMDPTEHELLGGREQDITFTPENWSVPKTLTVVGREDPEGPLRDGDAATYLRVTQVSSADSEYNVGEGVPNYSLPNLDASPVITGVSKLVSATSGSNLTLTGIHFDPYVEVFLVAESNGEVVNTTVISVADAKGHVVDMPAVRKLWALHGNNGGNSKRMRKRGGVARAGTTETGTGTETETGSWTRSRAPGDTGGDGLNSSVPVVTYNGTTVPPQDRLWQTVVVTTPAQAEKSYFLVRLSNLGNGVSARSAHAVTEYDGGSVYYTDVCPEPGQYGFGNTCRPCPVGAECPGGERLWPLPGYWNPGEDSGFVTKCEIREACLGGRAVQSMCAAGYAGRLCGSCADGYYKDPSTRQCKPCPEPESIAAYLLCDAIVWLTIAASGLFLRDYENFSHVIGFIMALQGLGAMGKVIGDTGSSRLNTVYALLHLFSGEYSFLKPDCIDPVPYHLQFAAQIGYTVAIGTPMLAGMFLVRKVAVMRARKFGPETVAQRSAFYRARHIRCLTAWFTLSYLSIAMLSVRSVLCRKIGLQGADAGDDDDTGALSIPGGEGWYLWADPEYQCYTTPHYAVMAASGLLGIAYVLGYPILYTRWIIKHKAKRFLDAGFMEAWNFCYEPFKEGAWAYYLMEFFISIVVAVGDTLLRQHPTYQNLIIGGFISLNIVILGLARPFHRAWENTIILVLNICNLLGLILGYFREIKPGELDETAEMAILYSLVVLMTAAVAVLFFVVVYFVFWRWVPSRTIQGDPGHWMDRAIKRQILRDGISAGVGTHGYLEELDEHYANDNDHVATINDDGTDAFGDASGSGSDDSDLDTEAREVKRLQRLERIAAASSQTRRGQRITEMDIDDADSIDEIFAQVFSDADAAGDGNGDKGRAEAWEIREDSFARRGDGVLFDSDMGVLSGTGIAEAGRFDPAEAPMGAHISGVVDDIGDRMEGVMSSLVDMISPRAYLGFEGGGSGDAEEGQPGTVEEPPQAASSDESSDL